MAEVMSDSCDEFVEIEEDDGEIVVIKSSSQLLKEAQVELNSRQEHINSLSRDVSRMTDIIGTLQRELACYKTFQNSQSNVASCYSGSLDRINSSPLKSVETPSHFDSSIMKDKIISDCSSSSTNSTSAIVTQSNVDTYFSNSQTESMDDFDILSNDKACLTDLSVLNQKRLKHKATQTRFEKQLAGIFDSHQNNMGFENRENSRPALSHKSTNNKISLSNALGWPSAFKEVGLNMICHLKQTMDPFNMACTIDNDAMIKDYENLIDNRRPGKSSMTCASTSIVDNGYRVTPESNINQKVLVVCPYCNEEMDSCSIHRHIQSMCGTLDLLPIY